MLYRLKWFGDGLQGEGDGSGTGDGDNAGIVTGDGEHHFKSSMSLKSKCGDGDDGDYNGDGFGTGDGTHEDTYYSECPIVLLTRFAAKQALTKYSGPAKAEMIALLDFVVTRSL